MTEFKLTQQDAPRDQGELFRTAAPGHDAAALLCALVERYHGGRYATLDDLLAAARHPENDGEPGICIQCGAYTGDVPKPWSKTKCARCETYTVTAATVIAGERR